MIMDFSIVDNNLDEIITNNKKIVLLKSNYTVDL